MAGFGCASRKQNISLNPPVVVTMIAATNFVAGTNLVHEQKIWAVSAAPAPAPGQVVYPGQNVGNYTPAPSSQVPPPPVPQSYVAPQQSRVAVGVGYSGEYLYGPQNSYANPGIIYPQYGYRGGYGYNYGTPYSYGTGVYIRHPWLGGKRCGHHGKCNCR